MKILIVEDNADSRDYLEKALRSQRYEVESAANGVAGLERARQAPPDLIISDILMPEMDGFELCRRVKTDDRLRSIPFVFYTATYVEPKDERLAMSLGASRFLIKPMELEEFLKALKAVLDERAAKTLEVPLQPLADARDLDRLQLEALAMKLDKKVRDLEVEHQALLAAQDMLVGRNRLLERIATDAPLEETLGTLVEFLETRCEGAFGSILLLDEDGVHMRHGAASSLPEAYTKTVDGGVIGPRVGSCGTAMFLRCPVVVTNILDDPLWDGYRDLVAPYGLRACWSTPIFSPSGRVLGSFAFYFMTARAPSAAERELVDLATHVASIAIEHHRAGEEIRRAASRLKESEERMLFATSAADIGTWHWDLQGKQLTWSDKCRELFGYPMDHHIDYQALLGLVHLDDRQRVDQVIQNVLRDGGEFMEEMRVTRPDGEFRWLMGKGRGFFDEDGTPYYLHGIVMDITLRKAHEDELVKARDAADAANRAKTQFLANMSHELRTPMHGIMGVLQMLLKESAGPLSSTYKALLLKADRSANLLLRIITDILDLSRIEAQKMEIDEAPFSVPECVSDVMDYFSAAAHDKGLDFGFSIAEEVPQMLIGDKIRLRQVLINLVGNAIKFTARGGVSLVVGSGGRTAAPVHQVTFTVSDTGIGIPDDKKPLLFRSFSQLDESDTRRYGGTGLGLAICNRIVELMHGTMSLESEEGKGSSFSFTVPLRDPGGVEAVSPPVTEPSHERKQKMRILLAEDDPIAGELLQNFLGMQGFEAELALDGVEAVEMSQAGQYDLIVMDVQMPRMDGLAATRKIRELEQQTGRHVPILALTAHAYPENEKRCLEAGMDGYLSKPLDLEKGIEVMVSLIKDKTT